MILSLVTLLSLGAGSFTETARDARCTYAIGPGMDAYSPVRAECLWPDVSPQALDGILSRFADHDQVFGAVKSSDRVQARPGGDLYRQVHSAPGVADREVAVRMWVEAIPGGKRYAWETVDAPSVLTGQGVPSVDDTGCWEVTAAPGGGSRLVYLVHYDPGGQVPAFIVRWFQTSGVEVFVNELREAALGG